MNEDIYKTQDLEFWRDRLKKLNNPIGEVPFEEIEKEHKPIIDKYIKKTDEVLDAGCGMGRIAHWFKDENYVGFDFVPEFIEIAKSKNQNKMFFVLDIKKPLPFQNKEFDWALLVSVKGVVGKAIGWDKWANIEKELKRVAKRVLILEYSGSSPEIL